MNLQFWKPKQNRAVVPTVKPVAPYRLGWNANTFKGTQVYVDELRAFLTSTVGQAALSALYAEMPKGYVVVGHDPGQQLGRMNGFLEAVRVFESLTESHPTSPLSVNETWGVDESEFAEETTTS